jgi:hypothetical protein
MRLDSFIATYVQMVSWGVLGGSIAVFLVSLVWAKVSVILGGLVFAVGLVLFAVLMVLERIFATLRRQGGDRKESSRAE